MWVDVPLSSVNTAEVRVSAAATAASFDLAAHSAIRHSPMLKWFLFWITFDWV